MNRVAIDEIREKRIKYLTDEKRIKAVTVLFSDLEGRLHLLDYDKKFLLGAYENLTFDGSSIRGFTAQKESDLRLGIDWSAFYWVPADVFGNGKVLVFGTVIDKDGTPYSGDLRGVLKNYSDTLFKEKDSRSMRQTRSKDFFLPAGTRKGSFTRPASLNSSIRAAIITFCRSTRFACLLTLRPKCSGRWAFRMRRTIRKSRPASLKSITDMGRSWQRPTRFSCISCCAGR